MSINKIARNYAISLYKANFQTKGNIDSIYNELRSFSNLIKENDNLKKVMTSPILSVSVKKNIINDIFKKTYFSESLKKFISVVLRHSRINLLEEICEWFYDILMHNTKIKPVTLLSAKPLDEKTKKLIKDHTEKKIQQKIHLSSKIDPNMIGGVVIKYDYYEIDLSVRGIIEKIRNKLQQSEFNLLS